MSIKRNWIIYLSLLIYLAASLLIFSFGVQQFQEAEHTYLVKTLLVIGFLALYIIINIVFYFATKPIFLKFGSRLGKFKHVFEALCILAVLAGGIILRLYYLKAYPIGKESDYKFYYDVAVMIKDRTLTTLSNNEFVSLFPHTYGYSYILALGMRIFGKDPNLCYYMNIGLSALTALFCYGIGRRIAGGIAGFFALVMSFFWPSQIIFSNINGAEAAFTCFLYGAAYLAVISIHIKLDTKISMTRIVLLHLFCGILIALSSAIRPMGLILLIAYIICLLSINKKLKYKNITNLPLKTILLSKGFLRVILVLIGYLITSQLVTAGISKAIEKDITSGGAMGYSLMVGTNIASDGAYNIENANYLYKIYEETESVNATNDACMEIAIEQIKDNPMGILELMAKKFYLLWFNDNYATDTNIITMNNQGLLTSDREELFGFVADLNNIVYLFSILMSAVTVIFLFKKDNVASLFVIFCIGTVALFLLVEVQNRYHYFTLQSLAILTAAGIGFIYEQYRLKSLNRVKSKLMIQAVSATAAAELQEDSSQEETGQNLKQGDASGTIEASNLNSIDVIKAIQEGHIKITATTAYADEALKQDDSLNTVEEDRALVENKQEAAQSDIMEHHETLQIEMLQIEKLQIDIPQIEKLQIEMNDKEKTVTDDKLHNRKNNDEKSLQIKNASDRRRKNTEVRYNKNRDGKQKVVGIIKKEIDALILKAMSNSTKKSRNRKGNNRRGR